MGIDKNKKTGLHNKRLSILRRVSAFLHDACAAILAWVIAYSLRFNFSIPAEHAANLFQLAMLAVPLQAIFFIQFGLYRGVWRFASLLDLQRILMSVLAASVVIVALIFMFKPINMVIPRTVLVLDPILLLLLMAGSRFLYRSWKEHKLYRLNHLAGEPVLVLGAGEAAITLLRDLARSKDWHVVGLLDDDAAIVGRELLGVKVLGGIAQLPRFANEYDVSNVIVAMPAANHKARQKAVEVAESCNLEVLTVPAIDDLISGRLSVSQIRKVEVEDLLGRDTVSLDVSGLTHSIEQRTVLVSGAGGSIGSELCKQILKFKPKQLICVDISEYALYQLEQGLIGLIPNVQVLFLVRDVKNAASIAETLNKYQPNMVFHAAAYKHVPMMEHHNVFGALENNVLGTYTLAQACKRAGTEQFVLISTDKAVNPTNVMGASKRMAEMVCQGLQDADGTRFVIVRFGNVLGSSGSVIPKFREQIANGGPVTVTHPEITRYFMSIPEAAQLVMQAGLMGRGGEIFVLDMGEPVRIADLAKNMIHLSGFDTDQIKITYTGLRPGEKLYEELLADDEHTLPTAHPKLRIAQARKADIMWVQDLISWLHKMQFENETEIKKQMVIWVSEYQAQLETAEIVTGVLLVDVKRVFIH